MTVCGIASTGMSTVSASMTAALAVVVARGIASDVLRHHSSGSRAFSGQTESLSAVGSRCRRLPGRELSRESGRVERQVPTALLARRRVRAGLPISCRIERSLPDERPYGQFEHQLRDLSRRLHAGGFYSLMSASTTRRNGEDNVVASVAGAGAATGASRGRANAPRSADLREPSQPPRRLAVLAGGADDPRGDEFGHERGITTHTAETTRNEPGSIGSSPSAELLQDAIHSARAAATNRCSGDTASSAAVSRRAARRTSPGCA